MPDFWEYPTVSMGLGPINSIYQARFNRYLHNRQHRRHHRLAGVVLRRRRRERRARDARRHLARRPGELDNLIWVVNCNLQRLDGPVRGNGKIIQELEARRSGAPAGTSSRSSGARSGTSCWRSDVDGVLLNKMNTTVDGEFQRYAVESGAYIREHFFGPTRGCARWSSTSPTTSCATCPAAATTTASSTPPTRPPPSRRRTHRDPRQDDQGLDARPRRRGPQRHPPDQEDDQRAAARAPRAAAPAGRDPRGGAGRRRGAAVLPPAGRLAGDTTTCWSAARALDGSLPQRQVSRIRRPLDPARRQPFAEFAGGSGKQAVSTTMAFTRLLRSLRARPGVRPTGRADHPRRGPHVRHGRAVQGVQDLRRAGPEVRAGRPQAAALLQRVASRARSSRRASPRPAASRRAPPPAPSYATRGVPMVPFFIFYSMFGFQRVGDLIWAAADARARGFLLGATAGRTTLLGEGLQHQDGHSLVLASTVPPCRAYDPAFAYEVATIVQDGIQRMYGPDAEDVFYYLTLYNENYVDAADARRRGRRHRSRASTAGPRRPTTSTGRGHDPVLGPGAGRRPVRADRAGRALRRRRRAVERHVATSGSARRRWRRERWNRLHPDEPARTPPRHRAARRARRPDRRRHRLHEGRARPDRPLGPAAVRRRSAPTASAAATPARRCAATSRPTAPTSSSPCSPRWPPTARSSPRPCPTPSPATTSTPRRTSDALGASEHPSAGRPRRDAVIPDRQYG